MQNSDCTEFGNGSDLGAGKNIKTSHERIFLLRRVTNHFIGRSKDGGVGFSVKDQS